MVQIPLNNDQVHREITQHNNVMKITYAILNQQWKYFQNLKQSTHMSKELSGKGHIYILNSMIWNIINSIRLQ